VMLHLGDCLDVMQGIPDGSVDMVCTDPPFGTTDCKWDSVIPFEPMWAQLKRIVKPNGAIVIMAQTPFDKMLGASNIADLRYEWIWQKESGSGHLNAKKAPMKNHENALVFYTVPPTYNPQMRIGFNPYTRAQGKTKSQNYGSQTKSQNYGSQTGVITISNGERYPLSVLEFARDKNKTHPTQKPVALMEYMLRTYTNAGETVLDFTMGSGTTGVAAANTARRFIGIEIDADYFAVAQSRIRKAQADAITNKMREATNVALG